MLIFNHKSPIAAKPQLFIEPQKSQKDTKAKCDRLLCSFVLHTCKSLQKKQSLSQRQFFLTLKSVAN